MVVLASSKGGCRRGFECEELISQIAEHEGQQHRQRSAKCRSRDGHISDRSGSRDHHGALQRAIGAHFSHEVRLAAKFVRMTGVTRPIKFKKKLHLSRQVERPRFGDVFVRGDPQGTRSHSLPIESAVGNLCCFGRGCRCLGVYPRIAWWCITQPERRDFLAIASVRSWKYHGDEQRRAVVLLLDPSNRT